MHERNPAVIHLSIHSEKGQRVYFTDENVLQKALNRPGATLIVFCTLCQEDAFARTLLYLEELSYYTWNETKKVFIRRRRGVPVDVQPGIFRENTMRRLYTVHSNQEECFYLRMQLLNPLSGYLPPEKLFRKRFTLILLLPSKMQQTSILPPF
ncbi:uncharacterized protein TNCV_3121321 [Trichonephila clavipes]|nr:uncharacterized protein TNCV_3121321 [Trichonephila clavipes]